MDQRGKKQKARDNIQAIRILKTCLLEKRAPTPEEQKVISLFYGFGGLPDAFRRPSGDFTPGWETIGEALENLTTESEYKALLSSTRNAHYTADVVVSALWKAVEHALPDALRAESLAGGRPFRRNALQATEHSLRVLEPSIGSGVFLTLKPESIAAECTGVEKEPISALIAHVLNPNAHILQGGMEDTFLKENFDLVIGNPPFGDTRLLDRHRQDLTSVSPNIHSYFFARSLDSLNPGGLALMVVSRYLMDADRPDNRAFRLHMHNQAELLGVIRLPNSTFEKTAFTQVVTDVIVLRKRHEPLHLSYEKPTVKEMEIWQKAEKARIQAEYARKATEEELIYPMPDGFPDWIRGKAVIGYGPDASGKNQEVPILGNPWFLTHPEHILGRISIGWGSGLYRSGAPIVFEDQNRFPDLGQALTETLKQCIPARILNALKRVEPLSRHPYPEISTEAMGTHVTPFSSFVVPEAVREAALEAWKKREGYALKTDFSEVAKVPAPLPRGPQQGLFRQDSSLPLIGRRLPDDIVIEQMEKIRKPRWELVTFTASRAHIQAQRMAGMIALRDTLLDLTALQRTETAKNTAEMTTLRQRLKQEYHRFVKKFGHLNYAENERIMRFDPFWAPLSSLEIEYDKGVSRDMARRYGIPRRKPDAVLSEIFVKRTQFPIQPATHADTAQDALLICLSEQGRVDPQRIMQLTGKSWENVEQELRVGKDDALIFEVAEGVWEERSQWLSGNVVKKLQTLEAAQAKSNQPEKYAKSLEILRRHQPERIDITTRKIHFGAVWLPESVMENFLQTLDSQASITCTKNPVTTEWSLKGDSHSVEYGTDHLSMVEIVHALLNKKPIEVKYKEDNGQYFVDQEATSLAVQKGEKILTAWQAWIFADRERVQILEERYNQLMNTHVERKYDGQHLAFPGMNPAIHMRPHQKNVIWRCLQSPTNSTLIDHVVGSGKTFSGAAAVMEMVRTGQARKPLVTVPNHLVRQWANDWLLLYPDARILVAGEHDMEKGHRQHFLAKAAFNEVDAVIMAQSSFDKIPVDATFYEAYLQKEIDIAEAYLRHCEDNKDDSVKKMEKKVESLRAKITKLHETANQARDDGCMNFNEVGFDLLMVDESHNYKNVPYFTGLQNVRGLGNPEGSQKAENMMIKVSNCRTAGAGVIFMTGTPISNTVAEMYLLQKYLNPEALEEKNIRSFDAWVSLFAEVQEDFAFTLTGTFKPVRTLGRFDNLPELVGMYREYADVINQKDIARLLKEQGKRALPMPKIKNGKATVVTCPMTPAQRRYIGEEVGYNDLTGEPEYAEGSILHRLDNLPKGKPEPGADNILVIINDLRKVGLDARVFDPSYQPDEGEPTGKLGVCSESVKKIYDQWDADKGAQLVFLDFSTPLKNKSRKEQSAIDQKIAILVAGEAENASATQKQQAESALESLLQKYTPDEIAQEKRRFLAGGEEIQAFSAYEELRRLMVADGISAEEIAFIHDADTPEKKETLFEDVRQGKVRVLLGSTAKMGPGMNVQDRLVAVHHLDAPYRPTDVEQRNGRILRQGNKLLKKYGKLEVDIRYYVTENSSDAGLWQILETKKQFIDQVRYFDGKSLSVMDPDAQSMDPASIKAAASGHDVLMLEVPLRMREKKLKSLKNGFQEEQRRHAFRADDARQNLENLENSVIPFLDAAETAAQKLKTVLDQGINANKNIPADQRKAFIPIGVHADQYITAEQLAVLCKHAHDKMSLFNVSSERIAIIGGMSLDMVKEGFTRCALRLSLPDTHHHLLSLYSNDFGLNDSIKWMTRLTGMLKQIDFRDRTVANRAELQADIDRFDPDARFSEEQRLQALTAQHQVAYRLLRLKLRRLDDLKTRLTGIFLEGMKKEKVEAPYPAEELADLSLKEGDPAPLKTVWQHTAAQEQDARNQAEALYAEVVRAFSMPPLTQNALDVLEKIGVSARQIEKLKTEFVVEADAENPHASMTDDPDDEPDEAVPAVEETDIEQKAPVDDAVIIQTRQRIGLRESEEAENTNPWVAQKSSAPFFTDFQPEKVVQGNLFDDLFADLDSPGPGPGLADSVSPADSKSLADSKSPGNDKPLVENRTPESASAPAASVSKPETAMTAPDGGVTPLEATMPENLKAFLPASQWEATQSALNGEEGAFFREKMQELSRMMNTMPRTYQTDGKDDRDVTVFLHYFANGLDVYVTELDKDTDGEGQRQAFGIVDLHNGLAEMGYIDLKTILETRPDVNLDYHYRMPSLLELKLSQYPDMFINGPRTVPEQPGQAPVADTVPVSLPVPESLNALVTQEQRQQWEDLWESGTETDRDLLRLQMNRVAHWLDAPLPVTEAERQGRDARAGIVLRSEQRGIHWFITGLNADGVSAYGMQIVDEDAILGRVDLRVALQDAPILVIGHEPGPLLADLRAAGILMESVDFADDTRTVFYRGGPVANISGISSIESILDYERDRLENDDVTMTPEGLAYQHLAPVNTLTWAATSREEAEKYGAAREIILNDPVVLMRDGQGGVLVAERKDLENTLRKASIPLGLKEIATMDDTCQRAVQDLREDGGWEAVQDSVALQDRQQDALDHIIHARAQSVAHALMAQGWERSGAAGFQHPEFPDIRIVGNGTTSRSGGNMVQWGYRLIMNRGQNRWTGTNIPDGFHEEAETFAQRLIENAVEMAELDAYIVRHIHDHAPLVAQQAKANTLDQFLMGDILKATSDAILEAIEDQTLPQYLRDAAKAVLQAPQGMTDYRRHIGQAFFNAVKNDQTPQMTTPVPLEAEKSDLPSRTEQLVADVQEAEQRDKNSPETAQNPIIFLQKGFEKAGLINIAVDRGESLDHTPKHVAYVRGYTKDHAEAYVEAIAKMSDAEHGIINEITLRKFPERSLEAIYPLFKSLEQADLLPYVSSVQAEFEESGDSALHTEYSTIFHDQDIQRVMTLGGRQSLRILLTMPLHTDTQNASELQSARTLIDEWREKTGLPVAVTAFIDRNGDWQQDLQDYLQPLGADYLDTVTEQSFRRYRNPNALIRNYDITMVLNGEMAALKVGRSANRDRKRDDDLKKPLYLIGTSTVETFYEADSRSRLLPDLEARKRFNDALALTNDAPVTEMAEINRATDSDITMLGQGDVSTADAPSHPENATEESEMLLTAETERSSDTEDATSNDDEDSEFTPLSASEKPELPDWKVNPPDMLSPLWDQQIPATWPNEHGVFPPAYRAEWASGKNYFNKVEIAIACDPQGRYRFSTSGAGSSYLPGMDSPAFATFLEAHTAAREEVAGKLRRHYASPSAERGFVQIAPRLLEGVTQNADGDSHHLAEADALLQQPPYQQDFHEILEHLTGNQRMVLFWSHWNERNPRSTWMVTLHRDADEQTVVAELRESDQWDFEQAPEYAQVVDAGNPDAWMDFIRQIADRFPNADHDALFNAPYGLHQEPVWYFTEPLPSHEIPDQPPAPRWPEDLDHDDLPVESPDALKNFDRYVGLRFEDEKSHVALLIARDKAGYVPAISYRAKNMSGLSSPNAGNTHYPTFAAAYAQGIRMLKAQLKEQQKMGWSSGADLAAKDWLDKKAGCVEPTYFGFDAARTETIWTLQDRLEGVTALQLRRKTPSRLSGEGSPDDYTLEGVVPGELRPRYINSVQSFDRALLMVNTTFARMSHASPALEQENPASDLPVQALQAAALPGATLPSAGKISAADTAMPAEDAEQAEAPMPAQAESVYIVPNTQKTVEILRPRSGPPVLASVAVNPANTPTVMDADQPLSGVFNGLDETHRFIRLDEQWLRHPLIENWLQSGLFSRGGFQSRHDLLTEISGLRGKEIALTPGISDGEPLRGEKFIEVINVTDNKTVSRVFESFLKAKQKQYQIALQDAQVLLDHGAFTDMDLRQDDDFAPSVNGRFVLDSEYAFHVRMEYFIETDPPASKRHLEAFVAGSDHQPVLRLEKLPKEADLSEWLSAAKTHFSTWRQDAQKVMQMVQDEKDLYQKSAETSLERMQAVPTDQIGDSNALMDYRDQLNAIERMALENISQIESARNVLDNTLRATGVRIASKLFYEARNSEQFDAWRNTSREMQNLLKAAEDQVKRNCMETGRENLKNLSGTEPPEAVGRWIFMKYGISVKDDFIPHIVTDIQEKNIDRIQSSIGHNSQNPASQEIFEVMTGIKLAKTQKKRAAQIDAWAGISPETRQRMDAEKKALREARQRIQEIVRIWERFGRLRATDRRTGKESSVQDMIWGMVQDGYGIIQLRESKNHLGRMVADPALCESGETDYGKYVTDKDFKKLLKALVAGNFDPEHRFLESMQNMRDTAIAVHGLDVQDIVIPVVPSQEQPSAVEPSPTDTAKNTPAEVAWNALLEQVQRAASVKDPQNMDRAHIAASLQHLDIPAGANPYTASADYARIWMQENPQASVQVWAVSRQDMVDHHTEMRDLRFYNGDPETRHVFLVIGDHSLIDPWMAKERPNRDALLDLEKSVDRDTIFDRYRSPETWIAPDNAQHLSPGLKKLVTWNPDTQTFQSAPSGLAGSNSLADSPADSVSLAGSENPADSKSPANDESLADSKSPAIVNSPTGSNGPVDNDRPAVRDFPATEEPAASSAAEKTLPVDAPLAAPQEQEDHTMNDHLKKLLDQKTDLPEIQGILSALEDPDSPVQWAGAAQHWLQHADLDTLPRRIQEQTRDWNLNQHMELLHDVAMQTTGSPFRMDFSKDSLPTPDAQVATILLAAWLVNADLWHRLFPRDALPEKIETQEMHDVLMRYLPPRKTTEAQPMMDTLLPEPVEPPAHPVPDTAQSSAAAQPDRQIGPEDRVVKISIIPLNTELQAMTVWPGSDPANIKRWKLVAVLQDGWEIPAVLRPSATYDQVLAAAQKRLEKWPGATLDDQFAHPVPRQTLEQQVAADMDGIRKDAVQQTPMPQAAGAIPAGQTPSAGQMLSARPSAGLPSAGQKPDEKTTEGVETPALAARSWWSQPMTGAMTMREEQAMTQINQYLSDPQRLAEEHKRQWIARAIDVADKKMTTMQPYLQRDPLLAQAWQKKDLVGEMIHQTMTVNLGNIFTALNDPEKAARKMLLGLIPQEHRTEEIRAIVLRQSMVQMILQKMGMEPFHSMLEIINQPRNSGPLLDLRPPLLLYGADGAHILLLNTPLKIAAQDSQENVAKVHAAKSLIQGKMAELYPKPFPIHMHIAYFDLTRQDVLIRNVPEIPGYADSIRKHAETLQGMVISGQLPQKRVQLESNPVPLTPEITRDVQSIARLKAMETALQEQAQLLQKDFGQRMGSRPEDWPHISKSDSLGSIRTEWSSIDTEKAVDHLSELGIALSEVQQHHYDMDALFRALEQAGIPRSQFVIESTLDPHKLETVLSTYGVPHHAYASARPIVTPETSHPEFTRMKKEIERSLADGSLAGGSLAGGSPADGNSLAGGSPAAPTEHPDAPVQPDAPGQPEKSGVATFGM
ncbi:Eco57I restriction-modification methylase domain-containing protein [Acidithiobacillus thiooxidans]|uniref:Eco57I restriction-modification methylase domain-containing protein n=2 Tax=Acidithiobacillus thiooxidans TaxID=930 RepID=UPI0029C02749|nr:Eco57I restriction-modification methylase domain-containing protein [Acidithiobacillus thiooxidans]